MEAAALAAADRREAGRDMDFLSDKDFIRISRAIAAAEKKTSGEIVAVVTRSSDDYRFIPLLWAALIALAVPPVLFTLTPWPADAIYTAQMAVFAALALAVQWGPLRVALVPGAIKRARAHAHAMEQFLAQNLHTTKGRTGVLIFVSAAERFAEVIADEGIYNKVPPEIWDETIAGLTADIARGRVADGFVSAIETCGGVLAKHFPPGSADEDELPNHLIVLE